MNIFNSLKSNFNKTEAKHELSSLAYKASNDIKSNQLMLSEEKLLQEYFDLTRNLLLKYTSTTLDNKEASSIAVIKDLNETMQSLRITNEHLKSEIHAITAKVNSSAGKITKETEELKAELEEAKDELFFTENNLLIKEFNIQKTKKEIEGVNIVQELERDLFVTDNDKANIYFNTENIIMQEILIKISKDLNKETIRRKDLFEEYSTLKKEQKRIISKIIAKPLIINKNKSSSKTNNDTNYNTNDNNNNNNDLIGNNHKEFYDISNDKDEFINEKAQKNKNSNEDDDDDDLEKNLSFDSFSNDCSQLANQNYEQTILFPNKVTMSNININDVISIDDNEVTTPKSIIPKLNLKQIEYNKSSVKQKQKNSFSNEDIEKEMQNDKKMTNKTNEKRKESDQILSQINMLKKDISNMIIKKKKNKEIIRKFRAFYRRMCIKYNKLQLKYLNNTGLNCEIHEQEEEDKFNHMCTIIQQEINMKTKDVI